MIRQKQSEEVIPMQKESTYAMLIRKANYAKNSRSLVLMYETYGMAKMARELEAITHDEFLTLNEMLVRDGMNDPSSYDD